jgi:integrase/recombinase XerD
MNTPAVMMPVRTLRERMAEDMDLRRLSHNFSCALIAPSSMRAFAPARLPVLQAGDPCLHHQQTGRRRSWLKAPSLLFQSARIDLQRRVDHRPWRRSG